MVISQRHDKLTNIHPDRQLHACRTYRLKRNAPSVGTERIDRVKSVTTVCAIPLFSQARLLLVHVTTVHCTLTVTLLCTQFMVLSHYFVHSSWYSHTTLYTVHDTLTVTLLCTQFMVLSHYFVHSSWYSHTTLYTVHGTLTVLCTQFMVLSHDFVHSSWYSHSHTTL